MRDGQAVYTGSGSTSSGSNTFNWNGQDNNGNQLPDGVYTLAVSAAASNGSAMQTSVSSTGVVSEVNLSGSTARTDDRVHGGTHSRRWRRFRIHQADILAVPRNGALKPIRALRAKRRRAERKRPMSLTSAMLTGVAALDANSQAMSITSSNIANVNTVGYKDSEADFSTFLTSSYGSSINEASVLVNSQQNVSQQGVLQSASSTTDLGIQGNGFFVTSQSPSSTSDQYYTRAGNFTPDSSGNLVNGAGYYLMGYPITTAGGTTTTGNALGPINVSNLEGSAEPSTDNDACRQIST